MYANDMAMQQQKVSAKYSNVTIVDVLEDLKARTGYTFVYKKNEISNEVKINETFKNASLQEVLEKVLRSNAYDYTIEGRVIAVKKKMVGATVGTSGIKTVSGRVVDSKGVPLVGVNVVIYGTQSGTVTGADGRYSIDMDTEGVLSASFIGFKTEIIPVKGKTIVNFIMESSSTQIEEVAVVAFGTQKKESVVSAITTIRPMDLKTSNSDFTAGLAGRVAGVVGWQTGGLPGALTEEEMNTKFYIRGITSFNSKANTEPLILLDGVETSKLDLARIAPEDIETFSVMKDASATAMYGARGANGVILVTTKKGEEGSVYTTFRYEMVISEPTQDIDIVDPITYMRMYNQALLARSPNAIPKYSVERINRTASGKYPSWVYPANDWYKQLFKKRAINHHAGVNIRGGSSVVQYYASVNYNRDEGMLKTDRLNDFNANIVNDQLTFRTNLNIDLRAGIKLVINSVAGLDKYNGPVQDQREAYKQVFQASPVDFAPTYPGDAVYGWPHIRFGSTQSGQRNPYEKIQLGYQKRTRYSTTNRAEYIHNLSALLKGLEIRASASLVQMGYYTSSFVSQPFEYSLADYNFETGEHKLNALNPEFAKRTLVPGDDRTATETRVTYEGLLLHTAAWKDHQTSVTGVFQMQEKTKTPSEKLLDAMPQRNMTFSMRGTYGFKDRYFGEFSFGYNGSERFAKNNRFGFFPAGGAAWIVSNEPFLQRSNNWLSFLKLRASYGKVGNDGVIDKPRFVFLPTIGGIRSYEPTPGGSQYERFLIESYANDGIQWEVAEQANLGIEAKFFQGLVEVDLDIYQEIRHNIISPRVVIPSSVGIEVPPLDNIGKARSRGLDFSGKIQHAFNNDFWIIINATATYNKVVFKEIEEATAKPHWQQKVGQEISQPIGYIAEGLFRDQAEIDNSPRQDGDVMPGDIRYRDINNDGVIDVNDATYIGYPETPRLIYGFNGFINYKNFELNFAFQGSGKRTFFMDPVAISPFYKDQAMLKSIYKDHWSEDNMAVRPFWPRLSTYPINSHNPQEGWNHSRDAEVRKSTYFMRECNFLRCTSLEVGYNLPKKTIRKLGLKNLKVSLKTNNLFSITNFKEWDVELGDNGFNYPIQRTYSVAININF